MKPREQSQVKLCSTSSIAHMLQDAPKQKLFDLIFDLLIHSIFLQMIVLQSEEEPPTIYKTQILHPDSSHSPKYIPMYDSKAHFCSKRLNQGRPSSIFHVTQAEFHLSIPIFLLFPAKQVRYDGCRSLKAKNAIEV